MKPKQLFFALFFALFSTLAHAAIWRVNSSLTTDVNQKLFQTINEANLNSLVGTGDTLMIESSSIQYSSATLTKPLILIGPGYLLTENPQTQANGSPATVQEIDINATAAGTVLEGLTFSSGEGYYVPYINTNNIIITRCYFPHAIEINALVNNILIDQNYFTGQALYVTEGYNGFSNIMFDNNYVGSYQNASINISSSNEYPRIFSSMDNNIFSGSVTATTTTFRSNIITSSTAILSIASGSIQNNLVANGQLSGNGNQTYNASQLFVGATGNSTDGQYQLASSSPYKTAGYNGTQPGLFGGTQPYVLSGVPPVPSIYEFTAPNAANKQTGLPVSIKVKANQ